MPFSAILERIPVQWGVLGILAAAVSVGFKLYPLSQVHHSVTRVQAQVDTLSAQFQSHRVQEYGTVARQMEFVFCRELERAGENPPIPCLQLLK